MFFFCLFCFIFVCPKDNELHVIETCSGIHLKPCYHFPDYKNTREFYVETLKMIWRQIELTFDFDLCPHQLLTCGPHSVMKIFNLFPALILISKFRYSYNTDKVVKFCIFRNVHWPLTSIFDLWPHSCHNNILHLISYHNSKL